MPDIVNLSCPGAVRLTRFLKNGFLQDHCRQSEYIDFRFFVHKLFQKSHMALAFNESLSLET